MATTIAGADIAREFMKNGYTFLSLPGSFALAEKASRGFARLLDELPPEKWETWAFNVEGNEDPDQKPDDGILIRKGEIKKNGGRFDDKVIFHYRPRLPGLLMDRDITLKPWMMVWLGECRNLHDVCFQALCTLTAALDREYPGFGFEDRVRDRRAWNVHAIRFLLYSERGVTDPRIVGKGHSDRNFITLQLAESRPGLRIFPDRGPIDAATKKPSYLGEPVPYEASPDTVLTFPGDKFEAVTGRFALWHDIVNNDPVAPKRWSAIFFSHIEPPF